jgi:hypothetical protein
MCRRQVPDISGGCEGNAFQHRHSAYGEEQILHDFMGWRFLLQEQQRLYTEDVKSMKTLSLRAKNATGKGFIAYKKGHTRSAAFLFSER